MIYGTGGRRHDHPDKRLANFFRKDLAIAGALTTSPRPGSRGAQRVSQVTILTQILRGFLFFSFFWGGGGEQTKIFERLTI